MKKALTFALSALLLAGCSQDDGVMNTTGEEVKMSFSVQTGDGAQTRAYGNGENIDQLVCAVYEKTGEDTYTFIKQEEGTQQTEVATDFKYEPVLLKGHTYKVVFWAMDQEAGYNLGDPGLTNITFPTFIAANADNMDVFTGHSEDATAGEAQPQTVKLSRPFGQLNFATTADDIASVKSLVEAADDATLTTSVEVSAGVMTAYNALTQQGTYSTEAITFTPAAIPTPTEPITVGNTEYVWLSTNFLKTEQTVTCTLKLFVNDKEANSLTVNQVPVYANTRTNIYGRLMTGEIKYNVGLNKGFTTPDTDDTDIDPDNWPASDNTGN